jgi:hypothetical protein
MLLGDGGLLLCSGGVFFGVRSGAVAWQRHLDNLKILGFNFEVFNLIL